MNARLPGRLLSWLDRFIFALALLGGVVIVGLVVVTVVDVAMRYVFDDPIYGAQDILQFGMLLAVFLSVAYCGRTGGHVSVDLLAGRLRGWPGRLSGLLVALASALIMAALVWEGIAKAIEAATYNEASNLLGLPHWPFYGVLALGAAVYALALILEAVLRALGVEPEPMKGPG